MNRKVKALLIEKGIKQLDIAAELDVSPGVVSGVISGKWESRRIKEFIAIKVGKSYEKLWGKAA